MTSFQSVARRAPRFPVIGVPAGTPKRACHRVFVSDADLRLEGPCDHSAVCVLAVPRKGEAVVQRERRQPLVREVATREVHFDRDAKRRGIQGCAAGHAEVTRLR